MAIIFWLSVACVAYISVGYPLLLLAWANWRPRPLAPAGEPQPALRDPQSAIRDPQSAFRDPQFGVSIVIAARNEGARLASRIENLLSLDYPASKRQIVVVSDGSTDNTLEVLARYHRLVDVMAVPAGGKALALNAGVALARHEIVVFADARQLFAPDALRELTSPFRDRAVGAVTGELLLDAETACRRTGRDRRAIDRRAGHRANASDRRVDERRRTLRSTIADGVGLYWTYEKQLRRLESSIGSTLGATGAIYAIRRALYRPLPADTVLDDVLTPMRIVLAGHRCVFNERARAFDRAAADADVEARRKIRTLAGNYQILLLEPRLLLPWTNPVWLQYMSHKVGRLAVPYAVLAAFTSSLVLTGINGFSLFSFYSVVLVGQVLFFLLAGVGALLELSARRGVDVPSNDEAAGPVRTEQAAREIA
jgi:poly-beta-1,6-N-acetyl-D-glucosamine synthase